jgi:aminodeoxyfutalosine deaminase
MLGLAAQFVLPVSQPPIRDGALLIDGCIQAVGPRAVLKKGYPGVPWMDLGKAILLPGLVNVHTHLELSALRGRIPPGHSFVDWVINLLETRSSLTSETYTRAVEQGITELVRSGTTCVGEVSSTGASFAGLKKSGLRGVVYHEVIGPDDARAEGIAEMSFGHLETMRREARGGRLEIGISPHAVYSVSPRLFDQCRRLQQSLGLKTAIHAAESPAEIEYLRSATGEIRTRLLPATGWGEIPPPALETTPVNYLARVGVLGPRCLLIHAVHLTEEDLEIVAQSGVAVAHCPRSNVYLGVGRAPLKTFRDRGIPVGLGTDSLASNDSLSLWDEIRCARQTHSGLLSPAEWIEMATVGGAQALGLAAEIGTLDPGKQADVTALALDDPDADPYEYLVHQAATEKVLLTVVGGTPLYERQEP